MVNILILLGLFCTTLEGWEPYYCRMGMGIQTPYMVFSGFSRSFDTVQKALKSWILTQTVAGD
jgi:hypothetical protein